MGKSCWMARLVIQQLFPTQILIFKLPPNAINVRFAKYQFPFRKIPFRNLPFRNLPFRKIPFRNLLFRKILFRKIPFRKIPFRNLPFRKIPFRNLPFRFTKLLGVTIDNKMTFSTHIRDVCKKTSMKIGARLRLRNLIPVDAKLQLYKAATPSPYVLSYCKALL